MAIDPQGGIQKAKALGTEWSAYWAWAKVDAHAALAAAREAGAGPLGQVVRAIGQDDPEAGIELLDSGILPESERTSAWEGTLDSLGHTDPARALSLGLKVGHFDNDVVNEWVRKDPHKAFSWLAEHLPSYASHSYAWKQAFEGLLKNHPDKVEATLATIPPGLCRNVLASDYVSFLAVNDEAQAQRMIDEAPATMRDALRARAAESLVQTDPERAFAFFSSMDWSSPTPNPNQIATYYPGGRSTTGNDWAGREALGRLARETPERLGTFLESLPANDPNGDTYLGLTANAFDALTEIWMRTDSLAFSQWLAPLEASGAKDRAIMTMNGMLTNPHTGADFEAAVQWSLQMASPNRRDHELSRIFTNWQGQDPEAMLVGLKTPGLPETIRNQFSQISTP